jgi:inner membrane protein
LASAVSHPAVALALAPWFGASRTAIAAGAVLSVLPDADVLGFRFGIPYGAPLGHRGLTHSIAFAALLAMLGVGVLRLTARGPLARAPILAYLFLCAASHGLFDGMTDGGLGVAYFAPFSNERFFLPWRPIQVSPLSVSGFFTGPASGILKSEIPWIWLPSVAIAAGAIAWRLARKT